MVPYDSKEARYLFAAPGKEIPVALAKKFGLVDGALPEVKGKGAPVPEWEKTPNPGDPAWSRDLETGEWIYTHVSGDDVYINGVLQEPDEEPPLPNVPDDDEKDEDAAAAEGSEVAAEGSTEGVAAEAAEGSEGAAPADAKGADTAPAVDDAEGEETTVEKKQGAKAEDKQKDKSEDKRILKSENKRQGGRR